MASKRLLLAVLLVLVGCEAGASDQAAQTTSGTATIVTEPGATSSAVTRPEQTSTGRIAPPTSTTAAEPTTAATATTTAATTTTAAPTTAAVTTTTTTPTIVLRTDGLGVASFGEPVEEVMAVLIDVLGPPDWEEVQISTDTDLSVRWGDDGAAVLYLQFTYWDYFDAAPDPPRAMPAGPVFHYYLTKSPLFATDTGMSVGSTVGNLQSAYPSVRFTSSCDGPMREFVVDPPEGWLHLPMWGLLDGESTDESTRIEYIGAGWDRSPC